MVNLDENSVSAHLPLGLAEAWRAFECRGVEAVRAVGLSVFTSEYTELRESARALSVCLGCHIQLSVNQSSITCANVDTYYPGFRLSLLLMNILTFLLFLFVPIKFVSKTEFSVESNIRLKRPFLLI